MDIFYGTFEDLACEELQFRARLCYLTGKQEYFSVLKEYHSFIKKRNLVFEKEDKEILNTEIDKILFAYLHLLSSESNPESLFTKAVKDYKPYIPFSNRFEDIEPLLLNFGCDSSDDLIDFEKATLNISLPIFRSSKYETLFLLRNIREFMDIGGNFSCFLEYGINPKEAYEKVLQEFIKENFSVLFNNLFGARTSKIGLYQGINKEFEHIGSAIQKDDYLEKVLYDIRKKMEEKKYTKKERPLRETEFGLWIEPSKKKRLEHEWDILNFLGDINIPSIKIPVTTRTRIMQDGLDMEKMEGTNLYNINNPDISIDFLRRLPFIHYLAYQKYNKSKLQLEEIDFKKEFNIITLTLKGYRSSELIQLYNPIADYLKARKNRFKTFCHGSLHAKNVIFHNNEFAIIDWELAYLGFPQDDIIRQLEGKVQFDNKQYEQALIDYFALSILIPDLFNHSNEKLEEMIDSSYDLEWYEYDSFNEFLSVYFLRKFTMHLWAESYMQKERKDTLLAKRQREKAIDSLVKALPLIKENKPKRIWPFSKPEPLTSKIEQLINKLSA